MGRGLAAALGLALLVPACGGSTWIPESRLAGWHAVDSGGTRLVGDLPPDELRRLAGEFARFDAIFARLIAKAPGAGATPLRVHLFRDRELARRFGLGRGVAGWALGTLGGSFVAAEIASGRDEDRNTLLHEYTHVLLTRSRRAPLPRWLDEGLATYFSTTSERGGAVVVGATPGAFAGRVARNGPMPLARLFSGSLAQMRPAEIADYYATAWALSHYLLASPSGRRELAAFVGQLERGVPSEDAQRLAFGRSPERLGEELAVHGGYLARGVPGETVIDASDLPAIPPPSVVALAPEETAYALGTLALALAEGGEDGRREAALARNLLELGRADASGDARIRAALGESRALVGDSAAARADAQAALVLAPADAEVRRRAARVVLLAADAQEGGPAAAALREAEQQYREALALDPASAAAWFGLGQTTRRLGRPDEALAALEAARRLGWSEALDVELARLHLARGERERARALLRPIAQDPHGGRSQREAARLLEESEG